MTLLFYWKRAWLDEKLFDSMYSVLKCDRSLSTSSKKSGGSVLIGVKRIFDVSELSTKNISLVEHECVKINVTTFPCMFQLFTWLLMLESVPMNYSWNTLRLSQYTDNSGLRMLTRKES
jgi:hypothetical protein